MKYSSKTVYKGKIFTITHTKVVDKDGVAHVIEKCTRPDVVTIIGITEKKEVVMIREFRPGMRNHVFWLPGGKIANGEKPNDAALREFEEETHLRPKKLSLFHKRYPSDNFTSKGYVYIGMDLIKSDNKASDENGKVEVVLVPIKKTVDMALNGDLPNELFCFLLIKLSKRIDLGKTQI
jgi:ADP-ribose pyrophosphatase